MAQYEDRLINGNSYTVPVGLRSDWKPGQAYNIGTSATSPSNSSLNSDSSSTPKATKTNSNSGSGTTSRTSRNTSSDNSDLDLSSIFNQMLGKTSSYVAPSESEMQDWASSYASSSINPLLSAIQTRLSKEKAAQDSAKTEVEAAYGGLPEKYANQLSEARTSALESAISRGMGRSGVVDWQTEKLSSPIMQEQAQSEREKASRLTSIANAIASAESTAATQTQSAEEQRAALEAARMGELQQWVEQMKASGNSSMWGNAFNMANLYNQSQSSGSNALAQALAQLLGGD